MRVKHIGEAIRFSEGKMTKVNLFETERMFCDVYGLEPGQEQRLHKHSGADKVYVVLEGSGTFQIGAEERQLGPNTVVLAASGVEHGGKEHK
jgi:mannose-6-phosphate isomerase-like protein (cupin superfamily)